MDQIILNQLEQLKFYSYTIDSNPSKKDMSSIDDSIVFDRTNIINKSNRYRFILEEYMVKPYEGFTFNEQFNGGINHPSTVLEGEIIKTTEKMYKIKCNDWEGWVPIKSCRLENI